MVYHPVYVIAFLFLLIFLSEWLCKYTILKHLSSTLLVIILGAIAANLDLIPSASDSGPVYDGIFSYVAPASIFFLLLGVNLKELKSAGLPMLSAFLLGSLGTILGVMVALQVIDTEEIFGENYAAISGMMIGTYTGGSANFNAVAIHFEVFKEGALYTGLVVADNILTAIWMVATLSIPVLFSKLKPNPEIKSEGKGPVSTSHDESTITPSSFAFLMFLGAATIWISDFVADQLRFNGIDVPSILILSTIALILAHVKFVKNLPGHQVMGLFFVYLFLVVIGAFCELGALAEVGAHAFDIFLFVALIVLIHGVFLILCGFIFTIDWNVIAIASQANIGGAGSALVLAKSFRRNDLLLPSILAGSLGSALGTYLGFLIAGLLA